MLTDRRRSWWSFRYLRLGRMWTLCLILKGRKMSNNPRLDSRNKGRGLWWFHIFKLCPICIHLLVKKNPPILRPKQQSHSQFLLPLIPDHHSTQILFLHAHMSHRNVQILPNLLPSHGHIGIVITIRFGASRGLHLHPYPKRTIIHQARCKINRQGWHQSKNQAHKENLNS